MQGPQTQISASLRDFIVLNADSNSIHKKVCSVINSDFCKTKSTTCHFAKIALDGLDGTLTATSALYRPKQNLSINIHVILAE